MPRTSATPNPATRRIAASRAKGTKSTTPQGKQAVANSPRNERHSMLTQTVVLASESQSRFEQLLTDLLAEHQPVTRSEYALIDSMAVARWLHMRIWSIQKNDLQREMAKHEPTNTAPMACAIAFRALGADPGHTIANTLRYQNAYERQFNRALREFTALKDRRLKSETTAAEPAAFQCGTSSTWDAETLEPQDTNNDKAKEADQHAIFPFTPSPTNEHQN